MRPLYRCALCLALSALLLTAPVRAAQPPVEGSPPPEAADAASEADAVSAEDAAGFTGAAWEVAGLEGLEARLGPLPESMADGPSPILGTDFAALCARAIDAPEDFFLPLLPDSPYLTREEAVVIAASAIPSPLRTPLTYSDAADIGGEALDSVEKLLRCGLLSAGNSTFLPKAPMTNACAAILLTRLSDVDRSAPTVGLTTMILQNGAKLSQEQQDLLLTYGTRYLDALARLEPADFSDLFDPANQALGADVENAVLSLRCKRWARSPVDLTARLASYQYTCTGVTALRNGRVEVAVTEYRVYAFRGLSVYSEEPLLEHTFTLSCTADGSWRIWEHDWKDNGLFQLTEGLKKGVSLAETSRQMLLQADAAQLAREATRGVTDAPLYARHAYDREAACAHADTYVSTRARGYPDYSHSGGNCQNFVSQCLRAGGIPLSAGWKPYVATWSSVRYFEQFVRYDSRAPVSRWNAPFYSGEPGDVVHCRFTTDTVSQHAMIVTDVVRDSDGNVVDYLVSSNTCNWRNFPLSAHWYDTDVLIKIYGWN